MAKYLSTPINTRADLVLFGRWLQKQGFWVWEHPDFYKFSYSPGAFKVLPVHNPRSFHSHGLAIDVNWPNVSAERSKIINVVIPMCKRLGFSYIYAQYGTYGSAKGHTGHIHIDVGSSTNDGRRYSTTPNKNVNVAAILGMSSGSTKKRKPNSVLASRRTQNPAFTQILQRIFRAYQSNLAIDGKYGPTTEARARQWQRALGVKADGAVGPATIRKYLSRAGTLKQGSTGNPVRVVQYIVGVKRDGKFGPATAEALRECQRWAGITADGVFGPKSRSRLVL